MQNFIRNQRFVLIGIGCGTAAWLLDAVIDSLFFSHEPISEQLLNPSPFELYIRTLLLLLFILFGYYAQHSANRLNQSHEKLKKLSTAINQVDESIIITDLQGTIEYVNPAFTRITGFTSAEAVGKNSNIQKSDRHDTAFYKAISTTIYSGHTWQNRIINKRKDGSTYPAMMTISPILDTEQKITAFIGLQQNLEKYEELEQQFYQAQKMEAIGTLVGGIAHDFNNSLAAITGNLFLVKEDIADREDIVEQLDGIEQIAFSAAEMIQQLLSFSRRGMVNMQPVELNRYLKELTKLHKNSIPESIKFRSKISGESLNVYADIHQLHQVVLNLINNARDAVSGVTDAVIELKLEKSIANKTFQHQHPEADASAYACISVSDNGHGISKKHRDKIFEPFFTTKEIGKGTGLGLSMVFGAVQSHEGFISIDLEHGTTFKIYLPLTDQQGIKIKKSNDIELMRGSGETILLVDDNLGVLTAGRDILKKLNYKVLTAADGKMAVEIYRSYQSKIDLLILDAVMPKLGGSDALHEIQKINPDVKALFISGYDQLEQKQYTSSHHGEIQLSKPFEVESFSREIHKKLHE